MILMKLLFVSYFNHDLVERDILWIRNTCSWFYVNKVKEVKNSEKEYSLQRILKKFQCIYYYMWNVYMNIVFYKLVGVFDICM